MCVGCGKGANIAAKRRGDNSNCGTFFDAKRICVCPPATARSSCGMDLYRHPVFDMACHQFDLVADHLEIPEAFRDRLEVPEARAGRGDSHPPRRRKRRGLHRIPRAASSRARPDEGRRALSPGRHHRRSRRARDVDELEMRARRPALRRREGRRDLRPAQPDPARTRTHHAPLHAGDHSFHRPADGHPRARHGHERADHGVDDGHVFRRTWATACRASSPANR